MCGPTGRFIARKGNSTFSSALFHGSRVGSWNMMPVSARGADIALPPTRIAPSLGPSSPATIISKVLLPQPDGPQGDELARLDPERGRRHGLDLPAAARIEDLADVVDGDVVGRHPSAYLAVP